MKTSTGKTSGNGTKARPIEIVLSDGEFQTSRKDSQGKRANLRKDFIMWDGEATRDAGYCLFGNSAGDKLCARNLGTWDLLRFIVDSGDRIGPAFHFGYGFDYDVDNILADVGKTRLAVLLKLGKVKIKSPIGEEYEIGYIPRKSFSVCKIERVSRENGKGWRSARRSKVRIDDVVSYFNSRYDMALIKFGIGTESDHRILEQGKDSRDKFLWKDIAEITRYWWLELTLGPPLMNKIRHSVFKAGFFISSWHGPGAIAKAALKREGMAKHKYDSSSNAAVHAASLLAYAGGRFERFQFGYYDGPVWIADINSAYPWAISRLPSLTGGSWIHCMDPDPKLVRELGSDKLALWRVEFDFKSEAIKNDMRLLQGFPYPLFQRTRGGSIFFPTAVNNWYYTPEVYNITGNPKLAKYFTIREAWIWQDDGTRPFEWVSHMYALRRAYQNEYNPAELALKLGLNSLYGSMAQRIGWDRNTGKLPAWHQIEWAGMVTSACRALVWKAAYLAGIGQSLISIDTDGIISTKPFPNLPNGEGEGLGRWKVEKYSGILYFQSGMYWLRTNDGEWKPPKTRGISRGKLVDVSKGFDALRSPECSLSETKRMYMGFRHAMATNWSDRGKWVDIPAEFSGEHSGTRWHYAPLCKSCHKGIALDEGLHPLLLRQPRDWSPDSYPHKLPWEGNTETELDVIRNTLLMESEV